MWITGGGTGIGAAIAATVAEAGAIVIVSGRTPTTLRRTVARIARLGGAASFVALDVADANAVSQAAAWILSTHSNIDVLVNCAGINVPRRHWNELGAAEWSKVLSVNLDGAFHCTAAVLPSMRRRRDGLVINMSSWFGRYPGRLVGPAYLASKHALAAMSASLNIEENGNGIRSTAVFPGETRTPIMMSRAVPPSRAELARMLAPRDVARLIRFLVETPPHVCINEVLIAPTRNRLQGAASDADNAP